MDQDSKRLWLIDGGYLFMAQRSVGYDYQFDYLALRTKLEEFGGEIWRAYYLNATQNQATQAQDAFHNWLRSGPPTGPKIITKLYDLKDIGAERAYCQDCREKQALACPECGGRRLTNQQQKGVDVGIATLALAHRQNYGTLILSSGDADLMDAIEVLSEAGKRIELAVFRQGVSTELQARADRILWIDDIAEEVHRERRDP